jgi:hypothetical protein
MRFVDNLERALDPQDIVDISLTDLLQLNSWCAALRRMFLVPKKGLLIGGKATLTQRPETVRHGSDPVRVVAEVARPRVSAQSCTCRCRGPLQRVPV